MDQSSSSVLEVTRSRCRARSCGKEGVSYRRQGTLSDKVDSDTTPGGLVMAMWRPHWRAAPHRVSGSAEQVDWLVSGHVRSVGGDPGMRNLVMTGMATVTTSGSWPRTQKTALSHGGRYDSESKAECASTRPACIKDRRAEPSPRDGAPLQASPAAPWLAGLWAAGWRIYAPQPTASGAVARSRFRAQCDVDPRRKSPPGQTW